MLQKILDYFGNPMHKLYNRHTGDVAWPLSVDAGETRYMIAYYAVDAKKWRVGRQAQRLPMGVWELAIGVTEENLIVIAEKAWKESE